MRTEKAQRRYNLRMITGKRVQGEWVIPSAEGRSYPFGKGVTEGQLQKLKDDLLERTRALRETKQKEGSV